MASPLVSTTSTMNRQYAEHSDRNNISIEIPIKMSKPHLINYNMIQTYHTKYKSRLNPVGKLK